MKKLLSTVVVVMGVLSATSVLASSLKGEYPACISQNEFQRLQSIIKHNDKEALVEISKTSCFMPKKGLEIEKVVSMGWTTGVAHVKVYVKGEIYDLWTNTENLQSK